MTEHLSASFTLSEFEAASHRPLTAAEKLRAQAWARDVLQPARDLLGPIRISSYVRTTKPGSGGAPETGAHKDGSAIDIVPLAVSNRALADLLSVTALRTGKVVQVIHYPGGAHVHLASRLVQGARPGYLTHAGGTYATTEPDPEAITVTDYRRILAALLLVAVFGVLVS